jgi:hypothetical protein
MLLHERPLLLVPVWLRLHSAHGVAAATGDHEATAARAPMRLLLLPDPAGRLLFVNAH